MTDIKKCYWCSGNPKTCNCVAKPEEAESALDDEARKDYSDD